MGSAGRPATCLTNDSDKDGDAITVTAVNGNTLNVGNSVAGTYGSITIASNGSYTYNASNTSAIDSAATGSHLTDTFTYTTGDGHGGTTSTTVIDHAGPSADGGGRCGRGGRKLVRHRQRADQRQRP